MAAAVPFDAERSSRIRPPQLITPARSQASASTKSIVVGDRTVRLLGLGGPSSERLLFRVASDMGAAIGAVEAFWGLDWPREISIVAAGTDEEFRAAAGGDRRRSGPTSPPRRSPTGSIPFAGSPWASGSCSRRVRPT